MAKETSNQKRDEKDALFQELISVRRVTKVVKGGKNFSFSALAVVGDRSGAAGYGMGKAQEVSKAIKKATDQATKQMVRIPLKQGRTLHHDIKLASGAALVQLRSAPPGTGVIAGGAMRAVFEAFGLQDVVSKSLKSSNPHNLVHATFRALRAVTPPRIVAQRRGKKIGEIFSRKQQNNIKEAEFTPVEQKKVSQKPAASTRSKAAPGKSATSAKAAVSKKSAPAGNKAQPETKSKNVDQESKPKS